jgi:hypothetical protein
MKYIDSPWAAVLLLMGLFIFIEGLHMYEHEHCRECPVCEVEEY